MATIEQKRRAIEANRGGLGSLSDAQVNRIWAELLPEDRQRYLKKLPDEKKGKKDADSDKS